MNKLNRLTSYQPTDVLNDSSFIPHHSTNKDTVITKGDIEANHHYWRKSDLHSIPSLDTTSTTSVTLPNSTSIDSTSHGYLPLSSLGQVCDEDCFVILDSHKLKVFKDKSLKQYIDNYQGDGIVLRGHRNYTDGLWDIPIYSSTNVIPPSTTSSSTNKINVIIRKHQTKQNLSQYIHKCLLSPPIHTLLQTIQLNHLLTFPSLTTSLIKNHIPKSTYTMQGHLVREKQVLQ